MSIEFPSNNESAGLQINESQEPNELTPLLQEIEQSSLTAEAKTTMRDLFLQIEGDPMLEPYVKAQAAGKLILFEDSNKEGHRRVAAINLITGDGAWALIGSERDTKPFPYSTISEVNAYIPLRDNGRKDDSTEFSRNEIAEILKEHRLLDERSISELEERRSNPPPDSSLHDY